MTDLTNNRRFILRLWVPAVVLSVLLLIIIGSALTSGDKGRIIPALLGIGGGAVVLVASRNNQKRRLKQMLQTADPTPSLHSFTASMRRIPHGSLFAAANAATVLALYGRFSEAGDTLESVSWSGAPPLVLAQASAARAVLSYAQGAISDGLDYSVLATQQAEVDSSVPGAATTALALRTYRNLGLALSGRATAGTAAELQTAMDRLPLLGQILAAWGLASIALRTDDRSELTRKREFIHQHAPHLVPVLTSIAAAGQDRAGAQNA